MNLKMCTTEYLLFCEFSIFMELLKSCVHLFQTVKASKLACMLLVRNFNIRCIINTDLERL